MCKSITRIEVQSFYVIAPDEINEALKTLFQRNTIAA
jgi:hypothetical protein